MLIYAVYLLTLYLLLKIKRAYSPAGAIGYLLVSGLIPLPILTLGNSVDAGIFPIDVCLCFYLLKHGQSSILEFRNSKLRSAGAFVLIAFASLATASAAFNFMFVDPAPWTFYGFTVLKFWEYAFLAVALLGSKPNQKQLRQVLTVLLVGISIYEFLHVLHLSGLVPMSGREYFGPRAANFGVDMDEDQRGSGAAAFSDRTAWFLTSYRIVIGGTASIGAFLSLMIFEFERGKKKLIAAVCGILCVVSVLASSSRSDMAGLVLGGAAFLMFSPLRRWRTYVCAALLIAVLYTALLTLVFPKEERVAALDRIAEFWDSDLRSEGDYASRAYDRAAMLSYLPEHPRELLIGAGPGNYHWYASQRITMNSFGHNSYLHWTGELGIGGLVLLLSWCMWVCIQAIRQTQPRESTQGLAARIVLALIFSRIIAGWGAESLFGTQGLGYYSLLFVGVVYFLFSVACASRPAAARAPAQDVAMLQTFRSGEWSSSGQLLEAES